MKNLLVLTVLLISQLASAQTGNILTKLEGNWATKGNSFGMPADITMTWQPGIEAKFMHLSYRMVMQTKEGKQQVFEGAAYYKVTGDKTYSATWVDSQGEMHPITATSDDTMLASIWGTPSTKLGRSTYRFVSDNEVEVTDYVMKKDGTWSKFNQNVLTRK
jgi:hypothetical protein